MASSGKDEVKEESKLFDPFDRPRYHYRYLIHRQDENDSRVVTVFSNIEKIILELSRYSQETLNIFVDTLVGDLRVGEGSFKSGKVGAAYQGWNLISSLRLTETTYAIHIG